MKILVTGAAGFIGNALSKKLLERGDEVLGVDNLNPYYDVRLKEARLERLRGLSGFHFEKVGIEDKETLSKAFASFRPEAVVNLAAQAGVRYSLTHPQAYIDSNIQGFLNILELCRHNPVSHLVYASSSSVYGLNCKMPYSVRAGVDHPVSLYAASKKSNELMAHAYSHLYGIPTTGLRFFTVYGPWGRPDMSLFLFTKNILEGKPIQVFNHGKHQRDFTYIDDIVEGVTRVIDRPPSADPQWDAVAAPSPSSSAPYRIYNIGNSNPVWLTDMIRNLEESLGKEAEKISLPMQAGDVLATFADVEDLERDTGFRPRVSLYEGIRRFVQWYREYYTY